MALFKKRGKHVRSAKDDNAETAADKLEAQAADEEAADAADASSEGESKESDLNKPLSLDAPDSGEQADAAPSDEGESGASEGGNAQDDDGQDAGESATDEDEADSASEDFEDSGDFAEPASGFVAAIELPEKKRHRGLKVFGIAMGTLVILACVAYVAGAVVFMGRFLPHTTIGEYDISLKSDAEVADLLEGIASDYQIDIVGDTFTYRATGADIGLSVNSAEIVAAMHDDLNAWQWPYLVAQQSHDESDQMNVTTKPASYEESLKGAVSKFNETATPPTNATIAFDEKAEKFVVKDESVGTQLDVASVLLDFADAVEALQPKLTLDADNLLQPTILSTDEKLIESAELATGMVSAKLTLTMAGKSVGEVDGESLSQFVTIDDKLDVTFKTDEMNAWVEELAAGFNTVGTSRTYTRADGKQITVSGGVYGWEIDNEELKTALLEGIKSGKAETIEVPCTETAAAYNGAGQRDWGNRYIDVDISEQHVRFYGDDGKIIWESDCITGSPDGNHNTWPGVWVINNKESPSKLIGYENGKKIYESTVTFWMPFEGNGIGLHDATWQPGFGGTMYANGYGSHGCVNLPYSAAQEVYGLVQVGDVVVVHD